jgi:hypothetical protein
MDHYEVLISIYAISIFPDDVTPLPHKGLPLARFASPYNMWDCLGCNNFGKNLLPGPVPLLSQNDLPLA